MSEVLFYGPREEDLKQAQSILSLGTCWGRFLNARTVYILIGGLKGRAMIGAMAPLTTVCTQQCPAVLSPDSCLSFLPHFRTLNPLEQLFSRNCSPGLCLFGFGFIPGEP
jgi:hypothetical protein